MILRTFNKDLPARNLLFFMGEGVLIYAAVLMAAFLRLGTAHASFFSGDWVLKIMFKPLETVLLTRGAR